MISRKNVKWQVINMVVEILYPHNCNLFGDRGNVIYLQKNLPEATFIATRRGVSRKATLLQY